MDVLQRQPDTMTYDVIIADPPYNIGKHFGNNHDALSLQNYVLWCQQWLSLCFRLLKRDGLIYVYGFHEILAHLAVRYPIDKQRWLAWHYTNKAVSSSRFWQRSHEAILCLWKQDKTKPDLFIDNIREPYTEHFRSCIGRKRNGTNGRYSRHGSTTTYNDNGGALPRDVISIPALAGGAGRAERWFACRDCGGQARPPQELPKHLGHDILKHPTQKPMALTKRLIHSRIDGHNGRVLIPFAGSGSECVVAKSLGIPFLAIEINPEYAAFARSWLEQDVSCLVSTTAQKTL